MCVFSVCAAQPLRSSLAGLLVCTAELLSETFCRNLEEVFASEPEPPDTWCLATQSAWDQHTHCGNIVIIIIIIIILI